MTDNSRQFDHAEDAHFETANTLPRQLTREERQRLEAMRPDLFEQPPDLYSASPVDAEEAEIVELLEPEPTRLSENHGAGEFVEEQLLRHPVDAVAAQLPAVSDYPEVDPPNWVSAKARPELSNLFPLQMDYSPDSEEPMARALLAGTTVRPGEALITRANILAYSMLQVEGNIVTYDMEHPFAAEARADTSSGDSWLAKMRKQLWFEIRDHTSHHTKRVARASIEAGTLGVIKDNPDKRNNDRAAKRASQGAAPILEEGEDPNKKVPLTIPGKKAKALIEDKQNQESHAEVQLTQTLVDLTGTQPRATLLDKLSRIVDTFASPFKRPIYQALLWDDFPPEDAQLAILSSEAPELPLPPAKSPQEYTKAERKHAEKTPQPALVLGNAELAMIFHPADDHFNPVGLRAERVTLKPIDPIHPLPVMADQEHPTKGLACIGIINKGQNSERIVGLEVSAMDTHMAVIGTTGTGKSQWSSHIVNGVISAPNGDSGNYQVVYIDPHGESAEDILARVATHSPEMLPTMMLIDCDDPDYAITINPLAVTDEGEIDGAVQTVFSLLLRSNFDSKNAPRAKQFAEEALRVFCEANLVLAEAEEARHARGETHDLDGYRLCLTDVPAFLNDSEFRVAVMEFCSQADYHDFWGTEGEYEGLGKQQETYKRPLLRAFQGLTNNQLFTYLFGSGHNDFDIPALVAEGYNILLKGSARSRTAAVGRMLSALAVEDITVKMDDLGRRRDPRTGIVHEGGLRIMIDEYPELAPKEAPMLFAQARKWDISITAIMQALDQVEQDQRNAILQNTVTKIAFRCQKKAAAGFADSIDPTGIALEDRDISLLPKYHYYGTTQLSDGDLSGPFSAAAPAPLPSDVRQSQRFLSAREQVVEQSHRRLYRSKEELQRLWDQRQRRGPIKKLLLDLSEDYSRNPNRVSPSADGSSMLGGNEDGFEWTGRAVEDNGGFRL